MNLLQALSELLAHSLLAPQRLVLVLLLLVAALIDWRTWRIPNELTAGGAALGLLMSALIPASPELGLPSALGGLVLGLALMLPLCLVGVMGAGDVKLMAMAGAFLGLPHTLHAALFVFVAGGVMALGTALWRRSLPTLAANLQGLLRRLRRTGGPRAPEPSAWARLPSVGKLPYAVSICAGTVVYVMAHPPGGA